MTIITLYALFMDDIRILVFPKEVDSTFSTIAIFVLIIFLIELVLFCFTKPDYWNSFFFWLDLLGTASVMTDIGWLMESIIKSTTSSSLASMFKISRAGRVTRLI